MKIAWWEYEELLEHLRTRTDIWTQSFDKPFFWVRTGAHNSEGICALNFTPPAKSGPYRMYEVQCIGIAISDAEAQAYLAELLSGWTSYSFRLWVQGFLTEELKTPEATARLAAIAISRREQEPEVQSDQKDRFFVQQQLEPTAQEFNGEPRALQFFSHFKRDQGYFSLTLHGDMIRLRISIRDGEGYSNLGQLEGFVRPRQGTCRDSMFLLSQLKGQSHESRSNNPGPDPGSSEDLFGAQEEDPSDDNSVVDSDPEPDSGGENLDPA